MNIPIMDDAIPSYGKFALWNAAEIFAWIRILNHHKCSVERLVIGFGDVLGEVCLL
jgi:hypothetical protein